MVQYFKSRRYFVLFFLLTLSLAFLPIFSKLSVEAFFIPIIDESQSGLRNNYTKIINDLESLEQNPVFPETTWNNNAEFIISRYVSFKGVEIPHFKNQRYNILKKINDVYYNWPKSYFTFNKLLNDQSVQKLDTTWLQDLHEYDHWNFSANKNVTSALSNISNVNAMTRQEIFTQIPVPNYLELRTWALVNLIKKAKNGRALEGLKTYRHVAYLSHTSNTIVGSITASSMLRDEYLFMSRFDIKNWKPIPFYYIDTYTRLSWAWIGILKTSLFTEFPDQIIGYIKPQNGICPGAWEASANYSLYLDFFQPQATFEADFSDNIRFSNVLFRRVQTVCNLQSYQKFLERSPASLKPWSSFKIEEHLHNKARHTDYNFTVVDNWIYFPYIRRLVGLVYFSNVSPINYTLHYDVKKKRFQGIQYEDLF